MIFFKNRFHAFMGLFNLRFVFLDDFFRLSFVEFRKARDGFILILLEDANLLDETIDFIINKLEAMRKRRYLMRQAKGIDGKADD